MLRCCRDPSCCTTGRINSRVPLLSTAECPSYQQLGLCGRNPSKDDLYAATAAAFAMSVGKPRTNQENKQTTGPTFRWMFGCSSVCSLEVTRACMSMGFLLCSLLASRMFWGGSSPL